MNKENEFDFEDDEVGKNHSIGNNSLQSNKKNILKNNKKAKGFRAFNLNENIINAIKKIGYKFPTPIQRRTIPDIISGFNIIAHSRTGSGKTAAFILPIINQLKEHSKVVGARCLILSPTRELAHQTLSFCKKLTKFMDLRIALLVGGNEFEGQFEKLAQNPDIIIATPGRVAHHLREGSLCLKRVEILAIDEADKIFELNFEEQIRDVLRRCPPSRQVLLFSATIPQRLAQFMKTGIREYKLINIDEEHQIPDKLKIHIVQTRSEDKKFTLISLFKNVIKRDELTLVFVPTKYHCEYLHEFLKFWAIDTLYIFGQMDQELRNRNLEKFKKRKIMTLLVTDVAARGLDIPFLDNVVNYDFPDNVKLFIHRIGRTARVGKEGRVINILSPSDVAYFFDMKVNLGKRIVYEDPTRETFEDFTVINYGSVPQSTINQITESKKEYLNSKIDLEPMEMSMNKAYGKALTFRQKPSKYGIKQSKKLKNVGTHPFFEGVRNQSAVELNNFLLQLKNFKPKESYLERVNETNVREDVIKEFKFKAVEFKRKKEIEKKKEKFLKSKIEDEIESEEEDPKVKPKKEIFHNYEDNLLGKKVKRSKLRNFRNNPSFVSNDKAETSKIKNLWGGEKPIGLEELTLNIAPDCENSMKKKTVWDNKKRNFVTAKVDKKGMVINESGKRVKKGDKNPQLFKTWKKKNKMKIQRVGEMESEKVVENAKNIFTQRKVNKNNKNINEKDKPKDEVKSFGQVMKSKEEEFKKHSRKGFSKKSFKEKEIKEKAHLNRRSQVMIRKRQK